MMNAPAEISWSTAVAKPAARLGAWMNFIGDTFQQCDMEYSADADFSASMLLRTFGEVGVARIRGSRRTGIRTADAAKRTRDGVTLSISCKGQHELTQAKHEMLLEPGHGHFFHNCLPGVFEAGADSEYWLVSLPASVIVPAYGDSSALIGCRIAGSKPELQLLTAFLEAVHRTPGLSDPNTRTVIGNQLRDLIVAAVGRAHDEAREAAGRGVRAMRYRLAMEQIRQRYAEPMLNGERLARTLGLSGRYLQQLFEENGRTISAEIINQRLTAARGKLADPAFDHLRVVDIAYDCGFSDASHFNRAFRAKFGETPKAARAVA
jgi:AraC-like DNA-binding protein